MFCSTYSKYYAGAEEDEKPKTRVEQVEYLKEHFRYYTMNSWNGATSYANCIKIRQLGLPDPLRDYAYEMLECDEAFWEFKEVLRDFETEQGGGWTIGQNGRSGGYLVLYRQDVDENGHKRVRAGSVDAFADFDDAEEWDDEALQARVDLVWDFDEACSRAVDAYLAFAEENEMGTEIITREVEVPIVKPREKRQP